MSAPRPPPQPPSEPAASPRAPRAAGASSAGRWIIWSSLLVALVAVALSLGLLLPPQAGSPPQAIPAAKVATQTQTQDALADAGAQQPEAELAPDKLLQQRIQERMELIRTKLPKSIDPQDVQAFLRETGFISSEPQSDTPDPGLPKAPRAEDGAEPLYEPQQWPHLPRRFAVKPLLTDTEGLLPKRCVDADTNCGVWTTLGECDRNPNFMLDTCRQSCNSCLPPVDPKEFNPDPTSRNQLPQNDGHAGLCQMRARMGVLEGAPGALVPVTRAMEQPRAGAVFVMRNGRNEGVWVSWPEPPAGAEQNPYAGCLHALIQAAGLPLGVPLRILKQTTVQVVTETGLVVPSGADVRPGMRLHLVLPLEQFQWPGIRVGHRMRLTDWSSAPEHRQHPEIIMETLSLEPKLFRITGLVDEHDADDIVMSGIESVRRSELGVRSSDPRHLRTTTTAHFTLSNINDMFKWRAFDLLRMPFRQPQQDGLRLVRQLHLQFYRTHPDYLGADPEAPRTDDNPNAGWADLAPARDSIDRFAALHVFLSNMHTNGRVTFPYMQPPSAEFQPESGNHMGMAECNEGLAVSPTRLDTLLYYPMLPEQQVDPRTKVAYCPHAETNFENLAANFWVWNNNRFLRRFRFPGEPVM